MVLTPTSAGRFFIADLSLKGNGRIGLSPLPGRFSPLRDDVATIVAWEPALVLSMAETSEMAETGCEKIGQELATAGVEWVHLPVRDYGALSGQNADAWPTVSAQIHNHLDRAEAVLVHCKGGQGRSGMIALRLMVERGEDPQVALDRLRTQRPGAVETDAQYAWAALGKAGGRRQ